MSVPNEASTECRQRTKPQHKEKQQQIIFQSYKFSMLEIDYGSLDGNTVVVLMATLVPMLV